MQIQIECSLHTCTFIVWNRAYHFRMYEFKIEYEHMICSATGHSIIILNGLSLSLLLQNSQSLPNRMVQRAYIASQIEYKSYDMSR